jgi:hypothetical protein
METIYQLYVKKITNKNRTIQDLNKVILWLTGYQQSALLSLDAFTVKQFFNHAPQLNQNRLLITGKICGVQIETIKEPIMKEIRYLDKLVDELAQGKPLNKILREASYGI